ncbi:Autophagy-related protein 8 [Chionoecetes opilio]|uniref:Autophagy-related protein 8 n=1 Tax=Chionoecetes opilio TaxID=41210 RepID=A0A8J4YHI3_CHIOP|nr:Autophagy-related protein 8 [Chionoecetes opilio]
MKGSHRRWGFLQQYTQEERIGLVRRMKRRLPGHVPLVLARASQCRVGTHQELRVSAPGHLRLSQLHCALKARVQVPPRHSLIYFIGDHLAPLTCTLAHLYHHHAHQDHFLYITFCQENAQG